ncbi:PREDICTED: uncharacterized protein LOC107331213 isoform X2 [Acropora digitifera]|uniref:uncharacterized protein LOC107331213 isoform X2 n=1 Tax=Acropora digitifera TaxID=70779 RepID=UPI00077B17CC|nr:PREDICTED: uncharacterized protein LOC107331213 isoform X2 [Acropora digitifera]
MQELEIEKKRYTAEWISEILNRAEFFLVYLLICCEGGTHTCYVFSIFLEMGEMLQQQIIQQSEQEEKIQRLCNMICSAGRKDSSEETLARRRVTWCPGVARSAASVVCNRSDGGKRVGLVTPQAKRKREDKEIQTEVSLTKGSNP